MKVKKGDQVKIISGNDKNKQGKILSVFPDEDSVVVEGMNIKKKHVRPKQQGKKGELVRMSAPLKVSRIMLVCPKCGKATRVGLKRVDGQKYRVCKKCQAEF